MLQRLVQFPWNVNSLFTVSPDTLNYARKADGLTVTKLYSIYELLNGGSVLYSAINVLTGICHKSFMFSKTSKISAYFKDTNFEST